jgi:hypothetical protein
MSGRLYKIIPSGLGNYEVHGRHPYSYDDQAQYNHIATHRDKKSAQDQVKFLTERAKTTNKELMQEKRAEERGYRNLHDKAARKE